MATKREIEVIRGKLQAALDHCRIDKLKQALPEVVEADNNFSRFYDELSEQVGPNATDRAYDAIKEALVDLKNGRRYSATSSLRKAIAALEIIILEIKE